MLLIACEIYEIQLVCTQISNIFNGTQNISDNKACSSRDDRDNAKHLYTWTFAMPSTILGFHGN